MVKRKSLKLTPEQERAWVEKLQQQDADLQHLIAEMMTPPLEYTENRNLFRRLAAIPGLEDISLPQVLDILRESRSDGASKAARKNTGRRRSRYASEYSEWERVARTELAVTPNRRNAKIVTAIKNQTRTTATRDAITGWLKAERASFARRNSL